MKIAQRISEIDFSTHDVMFPSQPLHYAVFISYTDSNDEPVMVRGYVTEERYQLKDNHKMTCVPYDGRFAKRDFYQADIKTMIREGYAKIVPKVVDYGIGT